MKAVILAAGEGKRLRPLTEAVPKPMVAVGGKPILEHTLRVLPPQISEVILVVGYKQEVIRNYFGYSFAGKHIIYAEQPEQKGTGDALLCAKPFLDGESFLMVSGDDLYHPADLVACIADGKIANETNAMLSACRILVKESQHPENFGVCLVDENDRVLEILEKHPNPPTNLVTTGAYFFSPVIFSIPPRYSPTGENYLTLQIAELAKQALVHIVRARFWHPIGYPEDVVAAEKIIKNNPSYGLTL